MPALLLALLATPCFAGDRAALHAAIDAQALATRPTWRALLHVEPGSSSSAVVDDWFFLAPQGRHDASAELHATLDALIDDPPVPLRDETASCVFGARRAFLVQALGDAFEALAAKPACQQRSEWFAGLDTQAMWLVFPTGYLNSPSSMFGHTLLRVDSKESLARGPLLAYAVNFIAETPETNGLVFAVKGLTGGYVGRYSVLPYYEKVREYVRLESRDLWEYPLRLSSAEQQALLMHLWELRGAGFIYTFLSRNCAYQLLALMQTVRPAQPFLDGLGVWAIPTDTVRRLQELGLLGEPQFRPALATTLHAHAAELDAAQRQQAAELSRGTMTPDALAGTKTEQARMLEVAHDLSYMRYQAGGDRTVLLARDRELLAARAATGAASAFAPVPKPDRTPQQGHRTQRLAAGWLMQKGDAALLLRYRPAYHDLLDDPGGYTPGSQINFGDVAVKIDPGEPLVELQELRIIDIVSLAPRDVLRRPTSWRASFGARREADDEAPLRAHVDAAPGLAWGSDAGLVYAYAPLSFEAGPRLANGYELRAGVELGAQWLMAQGLRGTGRLLWQGGVLGAARELRQAGAGLQWDWSPAWALRGEAAVESYRDGPHTTNASGTLSLHRYF